VTGVKFALEDCPKPRARTSMWMSGEAQRPSRLSPYAGVRVERNEWRCLGSATKAIPERGRLHFCPGTLSFRPGANRRTSAPPPASMDETLGSARALRSDSGPYESQMNLRSGLGL
jgi:hypothetical protein